MRTLVIALFGGLLTLGCDAATPSTQKLADPPVTAKVKTEPLPKAAPTAKVSPKPDPKPIQKPDPEPPKPLDFEGAWKELETLAVSLRTDGEALAVERRKLLTDDENEAVRQMLALKPTKETGVYIYMSTAAHVMFTKRGIAKLGTGLRIQWAMADFTFRPTAERIWNRSPKTRSVEFLGRMAGQWELWDATRRDAIRRVLDRFDKGEYTKGEREMFLQFAGDEYALTRPE